MGLLSVFCVDQFFVCFRNLAYTVTEEDIEGLFKPFGPLTEVNLPIDKITRYKLWVFSITVFSFYYKVTCYELKTF